MGFLNFGRMISLARHAVQQGIATGLVVRLTQIPLTHSRTPPRTHETWSARSFLRIQSWLRTMATMNGIDDRTGMSCRH